MPLILPPVKIIQLHLWQMVQFTHGAATNQVKSDINREIELDELKKLQNDVQESMRELGKNIQEQMHQVEEGVEQTMEPVKELIAEASENDKGTLAHIQIEAPQYRYPHAEEVAQEPPIESAEPNKQITDQR